MKSHDIVPLILMRKGYVYSWRALRVDVNDVDDERSTKSCWSLGLDPGRVDSHSEAIISFFLLGFA